MSKRLVVTYGDVTLYDDTPEQFSWRETGSGSIEVKAGPEQPRPDLGSLLSRRPAQLNGRK